MLIVVKVGGKILEDNISEIADDVENLVLKDGHKVVFVHGGGVEVTNIARKLGKEQTFVTSPEGFRSRYTDEETIRIYNMVMSGEINKKIVLTLQSRGVQSVGLSGVDGALLKAKKKEKIITVDEKGRKRVVDAGYSGKICTVNIKLLKLLMENGFVPVVSPVAISEKFEFLNVDGDRTAAKIAGDLKADRLVLLTDVDGVILNGKLVEKLKLSEIEEVIPKMGAGMSTKVHAAAEALNLGVEEAIIASGVRKSPVSLSIRHIGGTVITRG
ncbi:MAG: [LysW]-aminoadipate/[LysW]-glutamate kinase [Candidatus Bathyarchaeia archaeon]